MALAVTSVTVYKASAVKADAPEWETIEYANDGAGGGAYSNLYKFYSENGNLVNIQKPDWSDENGIYVTFPAGISDCSLAGYKIDGAGIILYLSSFTKKETEFTVTYAGGTATCYVYYENGEDGSESVTKAPEETTTKDPNAEEWGDLGQGYSYNKDTSMNIVNIQRTEDMTEDGIYMHGDGAISEVLVNGEEAGCPIQGGGTWIYLSALTKNVNTITIKNNGTATVMIKNANIAEDDDDTAKLDVSTYKANGTAPEESGKVFAGWYEDAAYTTPYTETTGKAYAKFVDEKVLDVYAQITTPVDGKQNLRFVGAVATKDVQDAGLVFTGSYNKQSISEKTRTTKALYRSLIAEGDSYNAETVFNTIDATYFTTFVIIGMDAAVESTWYVNPYWKTADGTIVYGTQKTFEVKEGDIPDKVK